MWLFHRGASSSCACLQDNAGPGHCLPFQACSFLLPALPAEGFLTLACSRVTGPLLLCTQLVVSRTLPCPCLQEGFLAEDDMGAHDEYARENDEEEEFRRVRQEAEERNAAARAACECWPALCLRLDTQQCTQGYAAVWAACGGREKGIAAMQAAFENAEGALQGCNHAGVVVLHVLLCSQPMTIFCELAHLTGFEWGRRAKKCALDAQAAFSEGGL